MTVAKRVADGGLGDVEGLLPWHAAGTLSARDTRRVEEALASDPGLAKQYAVIRDEYAETISLNESLGAPSAGAMSARSVGAIRAVTCALAAERARQCGETRRRKSRSAR